MKTFIRIHTGQTPAGQSAPNHQTAYVLRQLASDIENGVADQWPDDSPLLDEDNNIIGFVLIAEKETYP